MSIVTKTGDGGSTSLYDGTRVPKDCVRVEAYGTLDELDCWVGFARQGVQISRITELLTQVQNYLYHAMAELASPQGSVRPISEADVEYITKSVQDYEQFVELKGFVIPGSSEASARLDICRSIARRAERRILSLAASAEVSPTLLSFVNRLSDLFFIIARYIEAQKGAINYKK